MWRVLAVDEEQNKLLLISEDILFSKPYSHQLENVGWNECTYDKKKGLRFTLRSYLNNEFLLTAFPELKDYARICDTFLDDQEKADKVFILSREEAEKYLKDPQAEGTPYAKKYFLWGDPETGYSPYWLRDSVAWKASIVDEEGKIQRCRTNVFDYEIGVRPAIWIYR